jgi:hypothetical protein
MTNLQCEIMALAFLTFAAMGAGCMHLIRRKGRMEREKECQQRRIQRAYEVAGEGAPTRFCKHERDF